MKLDLSTGRGLSVAQLEARLHQRDIHTQVKAICCSHGALVMLFPFYISYGLELDKLQRMELSGESIAMEAEVLLQKWVGRGLAQAVLEAIRSQLFDIPAPTP